MSPCLAVPDKRPSSPGGSGEIGHAGTGEEARFRAAADVDVWPVARGSAWSLVARMSSSGTRGRLSKREAGTRENCLFA